MKKQMVKYLALPLLTFVVISCAVITVNVYFPTEAVEEAAEKIIDEIQGSNDAKSTADNSDQQSFFQKSVPFNFFGNSTVYADEIDLNLTTPAIRKLIDSMKSRNTAIMQFKDQGSIGETNDGMLAIRSMDGLGGEEIRTANRLLKAENNDREMLYKELATANKISLSDVGKIKTVFVKTLKAKAKVGHWNQDEKGKWSQKK
ncbi:MAG: YdbL family protein [Candidatus Scalindua sp.]|nr:YdbL family protein [Candidatus Scalindua sp.]MCR4344503.1 YdbL family protein [Candidatus Scalindua sp.]